MLSTLNMQLNTVSGVISRHKVHLAVFVVMSLMMVSIMPASAQSIDTSAFSTSLIDGLAGWFATLAPWMAVAFAVVGLPFALLAAFIIIRSILNRVVDAFKGI